MLLNARGDFVRQVVLNVIMTVPFGFLLPLAKKNTKLLKVSFLYFYIKFKYRNITTFNRWFRSADITDLITNVLGGIIGYVMYLIVKPLTTKILNYIKNR